MMKLCCSNPNLASRAPRRGGGGESKPPLDPRGSTTADRQARPSRSRWSLFTSGGGENSSPLARWRSRSNSRNRSSSKSEDNKRELPQKSNSARRRRHSLESENNSGSDSDGSDHERGSSSPPVLYRRLSRSPRRRQRAASLPGPLKSSANNDCAKRKSADLSSQPAAALGNDTDNTWWSMGKSVSAGALHGAATAGRSTKITGTGNVTGETGTAGLKRSLSSSPRRVGFTPETKGHNGYDKELHYTSLPGKNQAMRPPRLEGLALAAPITVRDGDPCQVTVEVAGIPIPDITWFHGSREIKNSPDFRVDDKGTSCTLHIAAVTEELSSRGVRVVARNRVGVESKNVDIKVYRVHTKWKPMVKSESFSTRSPDTFLRKDRRRTRKVMSGASMTSLNRDGLNHIAQTKPTRSNSVGANWSYGHASHSTDSILDEVFSFDRKSVFATSTPRDMEMIKKSATLPANMANSQISPVSTQPQHPSTTEILVEATSKSPRQKDAMTDSGFSENIFRFRSSETDDRHIEVNCVPPIALPEDFEIEPIHSPKSEDRLMSPREPTPLMYQETRVLERKPPTGRSSDTLHRDGRKLSATGQIWISDKKISKSLSAMPTEGVDTSVDNGKKYKLASQEKWESQKKIKRRSIGAQLEASPLVQPQDSIMYMSRQEQVNAFLNQDQPDHVVVPRSNKIVPASSGKIIVTPPSTTKNESSINVASPIIRKKTTTVPKRIRPVSETNLDDFVVSNSSSNTSGNQSKAAEATKTEIAMEVQTAAHVLGTSAVKHSKQLEENKRTPPSNSSTTAGPTKSRTINNNIIKSTHSRSEANSGKGGLSSEEATPIVVLGLSGKKSVIGQQRTGVSNSDGKDQVMSRKVSIEGPSYHPGVSENKRDELSSTNVSEKLSKAHQVMANIEANRNGKNMNWVYPMTKQDQSHTQSGKNKDNSKLPCVKVLDDAISNIYAEAFAHFGDSADNISSPLAHLARKGDQDGKDSKPLGQMLEYPFVYKPGAPLSPLSEVSNEDSLASSQNSKENFSNNNKNVSSFYTVDSQSIGPDLLNGLNTNSNNRHQASSSPVYDFDPVDVIALSEEVDVKSLRDQVEPLHICIYSSSFLTESSSDKKNQMQPKETLGKCSLENEVSITDSIAVEEKKENVSAETDERGDSQQDKPSIEVSQHPDDCPLEEKAMEVVDDFDEAVDGVTNFEQMLDETIALVMDNILDVEDSNDREEDIDSDTESVETVIEVDEPCPLLKEEDLHLDNKLQTIAKTLVDEAIESALDVVSADTEDEHYTLDDILDGLETPTNGQDREELETCTSEAFYMQPKLSESICETKPSDNEIMIVIHPPDGATSHDDVSSIPHVTKGSEPELEGPLQASKSGEISKQDTKTESSNQESLVHIEQWIAGIVQEALNSVANNTTQEQTEVGNSMLSEPLLDCNAESSVCENKLVDTNQCDKELADKVEQYVSEIISHAIQSVSKGNMTDKTEYEPQSNNGEPVICSPISVMVGAEQPIFFYNNTDINLVSDTGRLQELELATQNEDLDNDLENLLLNSYNIDGMLHNSRNRTSSLSSISEESEEDVRFVDETFQITEIPSTIHTAQQMADTLVVDTFTQIDMPAHEPEYRDKKIEENIEARASPEVTCTQVKGSVLPEIVVCDAFSRNSQSDSSMSDSTTTTTTTTSYSPASASSDSEFLETSIDESTLDLSWDSDMGPELSFNSTLTNGKIFTYKPEAGSSVVKPKSKEEPPVEQHQETVSENTGSIQKVNAVDAKGKDMDSGQLKVAAGLMGTAISSVAQKSQKQNATTQSASEQDEDLSSKSGDLNKIVPAVKNRADRAELPHDLETNASPIIPAEDSNRVFEELKERVPHIRSPAAGEDSQAKEKAEMLAGFAIQAQNLLLSGKGAVLFLLLALAVMLLLTWWQPAEV